MAVGYKSGELTECSPRFHVKHTHLLGGLWVHSKKILIIYSLEIRSGNTLTKHYEDIKFMVGD